MHTSFFFANALLNFPPNIVSMLILGPSSRAFGCGFLSLLTMVGSEDVLADSEEDIVGRVYEVTWSESDNFRVALAGEQGPESWKDSQWSESLRSMQWRLRASQSSADCVKNNDWGREERERERTKTNVLPT